MCVCRQRDVEADNNHRKLCEGLGVRSSCESMSEGLGVRSSCESMCEGLGVRSSCESTSVPTERRGRRQPLQAV